jgi:hypothetical protein
VTFYRHRRFVKRVAPSDFLQAKNNWAPYLTKCVGGSLVAWFFGSTAQFLAEAFVSFA